jgi:two-component system phosphate regulon sensor histidine kinase PhoR
VTAALVGVLIHGLTREALVQQERSALDKQTRVLAALLRDPLEEPDAAALGAALARLSQDPDVRIGVLDAAGVVLVDSRPETVPSDPQGGRQEVGEARASGYGCSERQGWLWACRRVDRDREVLGFVRVATPLAAIESELASLRIAIAAGALIGVVVALVACLSIVRRLTAPVAEITWVAEQMRGGRYETRVRNLPRDEIGLLGDVLNHLGAEITSRIATITKDDARLRAMLAGMAEGVVALDDEDRVTFANAAARRMLGSEELGEGRRLWELVRLPGLEKLLGEAREGRGALGAELSVSAEGRERALQAHATLFEAPGERGLVLVLNDITDLRRLERIRRDFVANVSHELKTPLTAIRGYLETLLDGAASDAENCERFLRKMADHVGRLNHLVTDLLSLARIEAQEQPVAVGPVDLADVATDAARRHERAARLKGLALELSIPGSVVVEGDRESLTQVIDNLVDNALKYTPAGRVVLRVHERDGRGVIEVADTGIGIPREDLARIFERFYRVDKARSRELGGTGLGLSIVKHLVQALRGEISVESEVGAGSKFSASFALAPEGGRIPAGR